MSSPSPGDYAARFAEHLDALGTRWVLAGALAAGRYRRTDRFTTDADFLIRDVVGVQARFESLGYEVRSMTAPGEPRPYVYFIRGHDEKVDLIVAETEYQETAIERGVDGFLTVEDVIIHKLLAWRAKDQDDIRSILEMGHPLDTAYIEHWATQWQVNLRWDEAQHWP